MPRRALLLLGLGLGACRADVYMQYPPGSNNRLDEGGGNRNNNNRLMDTQNNAKGGYGYGGDAGSKAPPVSYMVGSKLSVAWTSQHSCGSANAECQIIIQYMCNDGNGPPAGVLAVDDPAFQNGIGEGPIRDGTDTNSPNPNDPQADRGLHEPTSFYQACQNRQRNQGLYTADQKLNGNDATKTRQNPNGGRSALECPEERDYYPYWAPSPWKDLIILTNNLAQCPFYQSESQNRKPRGYCTGSNNNKQPIDEQSCTGSGGIWRLAPAHDIAPPECVAAPVTRDNHLGNDRSGNEVFANISIPYKAGTVNGLATGAKTDDAANCVMRIRYNITTADTRACSDGQFKTKAECEVGGGIWSAFYLNSDYNDPELNEAQPPLLPDGNPTVDLGGFLTSNGGTDSKLELAINTNQYGRTFQDRSHVFSIEERPAAIPATQNIYNLNVKGKRGNIVQTYPATEYDFHPVDLVVGQNDMVHIQWTGNDNTNNNGNNNGEGTNNEDRHNIVQINEAGLDIPAPESQANMFDVLWEWNPEPPGTTFGGSRDKAALVKQFALSKQTGCATNPNNDQQRTNCEKLNSAAATVNLGLLRFKPGSYSYMSSRNNNFSNRAQKAKITTLTTPSALTEPPTRVVARAIPNFDGNKESGSVVVEWDAPGSETLYEGTDGKPYHGVSQEAKAPIAYRVDYSCDGGHTWEETGCNTNTERSCQVDRLPAGTPCAFRVHSGSDGGWSAPSETAVARTEHSSDSQHCVDKLVAQAEGDIYLDPCATTAVVMGTTVGVLIILALIYFFTCRKKAVPPPPPGGKLNDIPPPPPGGQQYAGAF